MASGTGTVPAPAAGPARGWLGCGGVTCFVCAAHCTSTGQLSSRCLFLNRAAVQRHIAASKLCFTSGQGFREIQVEPATGPAMSWPAGGGAAGPALDVRHQPQGDAHHRDPSSCINTMWNRCLTFMLLVQWSELPHSMHEIVGSSPVIIHIFKNVYACMYKYILEYILFSYKYMLVHKRCQNNCFTFERSEIRRSEYIPVNTCIYWVYTSIYTVYISIHQYIPVYTVLRCFIPCYGIWLYEKFFSSYTVIYKRSAF